MIRQFAVIAAVAVSLAACGETASVTPAPAPAVTDLKPRLWPSSWVVTEIAGAPVIAGKAPTLAFDADGKVSGNGTCNRFAGPSAIEGVTLKFGALAATRMACVGEGLNEQEFAYFEALRTAERAAITSDGTLEISGANSAPTRLQPATP